MVLAGKYRKLHKQHTHTVDWFQIEKSTLVSLLSDFRIKRCVNIILAICVDIFQTPKISALLSLSSLCQSIFKAWFQWPFSTDTKTKPIVEVKMWLFASEKWRERKIKSEIYNQPDKFTNRNAYRRHLFLLCEHVALSINSGFKLKQPYNKCNHKHEGGKYIYK